MWSAAAFAVVLALRELHSAFAVVLALRELHSAFRSLPLTGLSLVGFDLKFHIMD